MVHRGEEFIIEGNNKEDIQNKAKIGIQNKGWDITNCWIEELAEIDKDFETNRRIAIDEAIENIIYWADCTPDMYHYNKDKENKEENMLIYNEEFHENMRKASNKWESNFHPDVIKILLDEIEKLQKENKELVKDQTFLNCLESYGVDNWDGYEYALDKYRTINFDD